MTRTEPTRSPRRARPVRAMAAALTLTALLGACSEDPLPQPTAEEVASPAPPAIDTAAAGDVLTAVGEVVAEADAAKDPALLAPRATDPAVLLRAGQYQSDGLTSGTVGITPLSTTPQTVYLPTGDGFPRTLMALTTVPEGRNLPQLLALQQAGARDPYKLWGWVDLYPGVTVPSVSSPSIGAATLAPDAGGLVASPQDVVARYVATLEDTGGADAAAFTPLEGDSFKQTHRRGEDQLGPQIQAGGTVTTAASVGSAPPVAIATADGGAIVMGEVRTVMQVRRTVPQSQLDISGEFRSYLGGNGSVVGSVSFENVALLAFHVPAEGAEDGTIQVLGAATSLISATRDDAANPD